MGVWLRRHEFEQATGDCEGQESLGAEVHGVSKSDIYLAPEQQIKSQKYTGLHHN